MSDVPVDLPPGTAVYSADGVIGTVEQVEVSHAAGQHVLTTLLVRTTDARGLYRLPPTAISGMATQAGQPCVVLTLPTRALISYYAAASPARDTEGTRSSETPDLSDTELRIAVHQEELTAETRPISLGRVFIHKGVETTQQELTLSVMHEEVSIEHLAPADYDPTTPHDPNVTIIPIYEERIVSETRRFVKEYLRIQKTRTTEDQRIQGPVRKEVVEVREELSADEDPRRAPLFRVR